MDETHPRAPGADLPVFLPEPMLGYRCNLAGCCCKGWRIQFQPEDLVRLAEHLPPSELPESLASGLVCVVDHADGALDHFELGFRARPEGDGSAGEACRFLDTDGGCSLQRRFGVQALPGLCAQFPVVAYRLGERVELAHSTLCPGVLDALFASEEPLRMVALDAPDEMTQRRLERVRDPGRLSVQGIDVSPEDLLGLRARILELLADTQGAPLEHLQAISYGFAAALQRRSLAEWRPLPDQAPEPFVRYLHWALQAHAGDWLAHRLERYARFVFEPDLRAVLLQRGVELAAVLEAGWEEGLLRYIYPHEEPLRPYLNRFIAQRYVSCVAGFEGEVVLSLGRVAQLVATALRLAAGLCMLLDRPLDRPLLKLALGAASALQHNDTLPPSCYVWFVPEHFTGDEPPPQQFA